LRWWRRRRRRRKLTLEGELRYEKSVLTREQIIEGNFLGRKFFVRYYSNNEAKLLYISSEYVAKRERERERICIGNNDDGTTTKSLIMEAKVIFALRYFEEAKATFCFNVTAV
jgi:hypothetical protein